MEQQIAFSFAQRDKLQDSIMADLRRLQEARQTIGRELRTQLGRAYANTALDRKLTQQDLAVQSGHAASTINRIFLGQVNARIGTLVELADAMGCRLRIQLDPIDPSDA